METGVAVSNRFLRGSSVAARRAVPIPATVRRPRVRVIRTVRRSRDPADRRHKDRVVRRRSTGVGHRPIGVVRHLRIRPARSARVPSGLRRATTRTHRLVDSRRCPLR